MRMNRTVTWCVMLALLCAGCAGRDFVLPSADSLQLGKTTYAEIVARFGKPFREATVLKNDRTLKVVSYAYSVAGGEAAKSGVTPSRAAAFYFDNLVLVGHEFTSSFRGDSTDFDEAKVTQIKKAETTEADVINLMGQPAGVYVYPLVQGTRDKGLLYLYSQTRTEPIPFAPKIKHYRKTLLVSIGENGSVTDIQFSASGEK